MTKPEKRNILVGVLLAALIAIAYQEMINTVRESVRAEGLTFGTAALAIIFSLTTLRFLIGNQMYLISDPVQTMPGYLWFLDLSFIMLQTVTMVFLGGLTSVNVSLSLHFSFFELLGFLFLLDIIWILTQWPRKHRIDSWKKVRLPWGWFFLNGGLLVFLVGSYCVYGKADTYSDPGLAYLLAINAVAFVVDVFLFDYYDVI